MISSRGPEILPEEMKGILPNASSPQELPEGSLLFFAQTLPLDGFYVPPWVDRREACHRYYLYNGGYRVGVLEVATAWDTGFPFPTCELVLLSQCDEWARHKYDDKWEAGEDIDTDIGRWRQRLRRSEGSEESNEIKH
jgi:hypothetical protein